MDMTRARNILCVFCYSFSQLYAVFFAERTTVDVFLQYKNQSITILLLTDVGLCIRCASQANLHASFHNLLTTSLD